MSVLTQPGHIAFTFTSPWPSAANASWRVSMLSAALEMLYAGEYAAASVSEPAPLETFTTRP